MTDSVYFTLVMDYVVGKVYLSVIVKFKDYAEMEKIQKILLTNMSDNGIWVDLPKWIKEFKQQNVKYKVKVKGSKFHWTYYYTQFCWRFGNFMYGWLGEDRYNSAFEKKGVKPND